MKVNEIRDSFFSFFANKGHQVVPSSSLIPVHDKTLLFVNAGMVQFKEVFLGKEQRSYTRAVTSQRCVRAGGKHNDLENVGYTARHHTFFEMLGNFSFGDYFKREAIEYAWEYLTKVLKLPKEKLWITVFETDDEAADIWLKDIGVSPDRFSRCKEKDNFWSMGDTGPCGPCTEIFYDHGPDVPGGPPGSADEDGDRYVEIWNLVFMQYNRAADGSLTDLPKPSVDTGMGLERLSAVLQNVHSNYDIDLFQDLIKFIAKLLNCKTLDNKGLLVIADHIRSTAFLIADGVIPSNEGRGYVLRRIMRRAIRHGNQLGCKEPFFYKIIAPLVKYMGQAYPELKDNQAYIEKLTLKEEKQFAKTLDQGLGILQEHMQNAKDIIAGDIVFKLYDTYGFPVDLTADIAKEQGLAIDHQGFEDCMQQQRERARQSSSFKADYNQADEFAGLASEFKGYREVETKSKIVGIFADKKTINKLTAGQKANIILENTPFYAESGGQVGDKGVLISQDGSAKFKVLDTQKQGEAIIHIGKLETGELAANDLVTATINTELRKATKLNHSATHLLHAVLREVLGKHVMQKGSLVEPQRLRFDFSHFEGLNNQQLQTIEQKVNEKILENTEVSTEIMSIESAKQKGAMALFGEKYADEVRVLTMGAGYSVELCGGTHVKRTGDIGLFKIILETGIASGVRRIEALTGQAALEWLNDKYTTLQTVSHALKADSNNVVDKIKQLVSKNKQLEKDNSKMQAQLASQSGGDLTADAVAIKDIKLLVKNLPNADMAVMRKLVDDLKSKLGNGVILLATINNDKAQLIAGVSKECTKQVHAGELVNFVASQVGGKGGGRPDMAQAGGTQPENLEAALSSVQAWVAEKL